MPNKINHFILTTSMKRNLLCASRTLFLLALCCFSLPVVLMAQSSVNMPKKAYEIVEQTVNGEIKFYDDGGAKKSSASSSTFSMIRFKPSSPDKKLTIKFLSSEEANGEDSAIIYIYNGIVDWKTDGTTKTKPDNPAVTHFTGEALPTFTSTSGDGAITVVVYSEWGVNWEAVVSEPASGNIEITNIALVSGTNVAPKGLKQAKLLQGNIAVSGVDNPLSLSALKFIGLGNSFSNYKIKIGNQALRDFNPADGSIVATKIDRTGLLFELYADVPTSEQTQNAIDVSLSKLTINGKEQTPPNATKTTITLADELWMRQGKSEVLVDAPLHFYDDGGKSGKYTKDFRGVTTFYPKQPGTKVVIEFTKLALFNTSSTGKNDRLNIYSGNTVTPNALLANYLKELGVTYSTASDGSLTVQFESVTAYPKDGFEAIVRCEKPRAMEFKLAQIEPIKLTTPLTAQTQNSQEVAELIIETSYSLPALTITSLQFSNVKQISGITLYKNNPAEELGKVTLAEDASNAILTFTKPLVLTSGKNTFGIRITLNPKAVTNSEYALSLNTIVSESKKQIALADGKNSISGKVNNHAIATKGKQTITLYSPWSFGAEMNKYSNSSYETTGGDRVVTFVTPNEGDVVSIDFSSFNIGMNSYSPKPIFKIFDGETTKGTVLYELTNDTKNSGPSSKLFSSGKALTVQVDFKGGARGKGWDAIVKSEKAPRKAITSLKQAELGTKSISKLTSSEVAIAELVITALPYQAERAINRIEATVQGNQSLISKYLLYKKSGKNEVKVAELSTLNNGTLSFSLSGADANLSAGENSYILRVVPNSKATGENVIMFAFSKMLLKGEAEPFIVDAPEAPITKEVVAIITQHTKGDKQTYTIPEGATVIYTDEGALEGKMDGSAYETAITFVPEKAGNIVVLSVDGKVNIGNRDKIYIYSGKEVVNDKLIATLGSSTKSGVYWSSSADGALTVLVSSTKKTGSLKYDGWKFNLITKAPSIRTSEVIDVVALPKKEVTFGSTNIPVASLLFKIQGESGKAMLPRTEVTAPNAKAVTLYFAGPDTIFSPSLPKIVGEKQNGSDTFVFVDKEGRELNGNVYAFIAVDVPTEGNANESVNITINKVGVNNYNNVTTTLTLKQGLKGEYTVGASKGSQYKSLKEVQEALKQGVSGKVIFVFEPGTYEAPFTLENVLGASENNTITFTSKTGKAEDVTITHAANASEVGYNGAKGLVIVDNTPYVTFEALTFSMPKKKVADNVIYVTNSSSNFTLRNSVVIGLQEETNDFKAKFNGINFQSGKNNHTQSNNVVVEGNRFSGSYAPIYIYGAMNVSFAVPENYLIKGNTMVNPFGKAIYVATALNGLVIDNNSVTIDYANKTSNGAQMWAFDLRLGGTGEKIVNNRIFSKNNNKITALYIQKDNSKAVYTSGTLIANNSIVLTAPVANSQARFPEVIGIRMLEKGDLMHNVTIAYNSVRLEKGDGSSLENARAFALVKGDNVVVKNNIFYNTINNCVGAIYKGKEGLTFGNNVYYSGMEKPFSVVGKDINSLDEWNTLVGDTNSKDIKPVFIDATSTVLKEVEAFKFAVPMAEVKSDINGLPRDAKNPIVGAYELADDSKLELKLNNIKVVDKKPNTATVSFDAERNATLYYILAEKSATKPTEDVVLNATSVVCIAKETKELKFDNLKPSTEYVLYGMLKALTDEKQTEVYELIAFTTSEKPFVAAKFDNVTNYTAGQPFVDGSLKFENITIDKDGDNGIARRADNLVATISLPFNPSGVVLNSMLIRGKGNVTVASSEGKSRILKLNDENNFVLVNLQKLGAVTKLTLTGGESVAIDSLGCIAGTPAIMVKAVTTKQGEAAILEVVTTNAAVPYKLASVRNDMDVEYSEVWTNKVTMQPASPVATTEYEFTLTDEAERNATGTGFIAVYSKENKPLLASFEEPMVESESMARFKSSFYSGSFAFPTSYNAQWGSWSGFAVSRSGKTDFKDYKESQFNVPTGHGAKGSKAFGVFYKSYGADDAIAVVDPLIAQPISGMWVSITSYTLSHVEKGDSMAPDGFKDGNYYTVIVTADNGKKIEIPVADYRNGKKSVIKEWTWVDFTALGNIKTLTFTVDGNVKNEYGLLTPAYLAIDDLNGTSSTDDASIITGVNAEVVLAGNSLHINNADGALVAIYDLTGKLMEQFHAQGDTYVKDLSFDKGTYVVVCAGTRTKIVL